MPGLINVVFTFIIRHSTGPSTGVDGTFTIAAKENAILVFSAIGYEIKEVAAGDKTYLAARGTLTAANALQRIMEEKNIANFLNEENFTDWRRTGFPVLTKVQGALSDIPRRLLYPESDILTNAQPQQSAVLTDRVWWDAQ